MRSTKATSMFTTIVAVLCHLSGPATGACVEEIVSRQRYGSGPHVSGLRYQRPGRHREVDERPSALPIRLASRPLQVRSGSLRNSRQGINAERRQPVRHRRDRDAKDADALFDKLKGWIKLDYNSKGQVKWRKEAREDFDFEAGEQLSEDDKAILQDAKRPIVIFNRIGTTVDSVAGQEVGNRQEVQFLPRTQGVVKKNELLTSAAKWFRQQCDAEDEESDAFRDMVVCGMGWTETRLDYEDNPEGDPKIDRTDPLEMGWDSGAKKRNLVDGRRVFHIRRDVPIDEARALCPGDPDHPFEDADYNATWLADEKEGEEPHHNNATTYDKEDRRGRGRRRMRDDGPHPVVGACAGLSGARSDRPRKCHPHACA
jgi:hypothetical protein